MLALLQSTAWRASFTLLLELRSDSEIQQLHVYYLGLWCLGGLSALNLRSEPPRAGQDALVCF